MRATILSLLVGLTCAGVAVQPRVVELPPAGTGLRHMIVMVKSPANMNERELGAFQIIGTSLLSGTKDFIREDLFSNLINAGMAPKVWWTDDLIVLQTAANPGSEGIVARMIESILTAPLISEEQMTKSAELLRSVRGDDFSANLLGWRGDLGAGEVFVNQFAKTVFRPDSVTIAVSPEAKRAIETRFQEWENPRIQRDLRVGRKVPFRGPETATVTRFSGDPFVPGPMTADKMLAMVGLGAGKTGLLFKVVRENLRASYRQEAFLYPTARGMKPMMMFSGSGNLPDEFEGELQKAIASYTEADLARIKVLANASWQGQIPIHPFWSSAYGPKSERETDAAMMRALCALWGLSPDVWDGLLQDFSGVKLEELKSASIELLKSFSGIKEDAPK